MLMNGREVLVTRHEAARRACVTFNTIVRWIKAGRLHPVSEPGAGRPTIRLEELDALVEAEDRLARRHRTRVWGGPRAS
jgi:predicted site-specific integrase-resolvase